MVFRCVIQLNLRLNKQPETKIAIRPVVSNQFYFQPLRSRNDVMCAT